MNLSHSQPGLKATAGCRRGSQQARQHGLEVNASIEAALVLSEITVGILCKIERMIGTTQGGFQVTPQGVNPAKAGHVGAAARSTNHLGLMLAARGRDGSKTRQTIRDHATSLMVDRLKKTDPVALVEEMETKILKPIDR